MLEDAFLFARWLAKIVFFIFPFIPAKRAKEMPFSFVEGKHCACGKLFRHHFLLLRKLVPAFHFLRAAAQAVDLLKTFHNSLRLISNGLKSREVLALESINDEKSKFCARRNFASFRGQILVFRKRKRNSIFTRAAIIAPKFRARRRFCGYDVGDFHTTYAQMEKFIEAVAKAAPDRVKIFDIGTTNEYRMQHIVAISSPENIARLDEIKADNARLADPRRSFAAEANQHRSKQSGDRMDGLHDPRQRIGVVRSDDAGHLSARRLERAGRRSTF